MIRNYGTLLLILLVFAFGESKSQTNGKSNTNLQEDKVYTFIPVMPQFPGGEVAMFEFIISNIKYPVLAVDSNITGKVFVNFVIDKEGNVTDPRILRGIGGGCDEEVLRLVTSMPRWTPGELESGEKVKVSFNLPISFTLNDPKQNK